MLVATSPATHAGQPNLEIERREGERHADLGREHTFRVGGAEPSRVDPSRAPFHAFYSRHRPQTAGQPQTGVRDALAETRRVGVRGRECGLNGDRAVHRAAASAASA